MNRKRREQLILEAAVRMFMRRGYARTSVSDIIREGKVARGTFYLYFKSKKDLITILADRFMNEISAATRQIVLAGRTGDLEDLVRQQASDLIATLTRNRLLARLLLTDTGIDADVSARLNFFYSQMGDIIRQRLEENVKNGVFRGCEANVAARSIIGAIKENISVWMTQDNLELEPTIRGLIDYLLHGLVVPAEKNLHAEAEKPISRAAFGGSFH